MLKKSIVLAAIAASFSISSAQAFETYFSPKDNLEGVFAEKFKAAEKSIDLVIYTFSSKIVRDVLIERLANGVKVRIVINDGDDEAVAAFVAPIQAAGASVRYVTPINHHKFAVVDGKQLLNSSGNLAGSALSKSYDENLVVCDSDCPALKSAFEQEFKAISAVSNLVGGPNDVKGLKPGQAGKPVNTNVDGVALFTSSNYLPKFDAKRQKITVTTEDRADGTGNVDSALIDAINGAKKEIKVATGHFRSKTLFDALVKAVKRGVKVIVISDGQEYVSPEAEKKQDAELKECMKTDTEVECEKTGSMFSRRLAEAGVDMNLKYYTFIWNFVVAPQMHSKYMIIDGETLYSGSYNYSYNAEYQSFENVAIYRSADAKEVIESYKKNFDDVLNYGGGPAGNAKFMAAFKEAKEISFVFPPVTMTLSQVDKFIALALKKCPTLFNKRSDAKVCKSVN